MNFPLTITATITQDDIKQGRAEDCRNCPIARAVTRELPAGYFSTVGTSVASIRPAAKDDSIIAFADLGANAEFFVGCFDNDNYVEPFTLTLTFNEAL